MHVVADTSITRTLTLALRSLGGAERLAAHLGVSESRLREWLAGRGQPPTDVYLRALDVVAKGPFAT
jgi:DNA-binding transcriptional regulator YdaS (Cro superfamily)